MSLRVVSVAVLLVGCTTVGPDYKKPESEKKLPKDFHAPPDPSLKPGTADLEKWWQLFGDAQLNELIQRAAKQNLDVRIAIARVNAARARVDVATAGRSPQVALGSNAGIAGTGGLARSSYGASIDASWELDVFGKIDRQVEAATAKFKASVEDRRDVMVTLYAEVARNYLSVRTSQERLQAAQRNIEAQRKILEIAKGRFAAGLTSRLDVVKAERILADSESEVPPLRIQLARSINTIGLLLGQFPRELHRELKTDKPIPLPPQSVSVGVPANLVRQRPDIRGAERLLAAQTAAVGIATADLYPQFSLNGNLGFSGSDGSNLFDAAGRSLSLGPSLRWNIFDGGRVRAQIRVEGFLVEQALLKYESTVLRALEEVESAIVAFLESRIRAESVGRAARLAREELKLGMDLYKQGLADFQSVLDAERAVFGLESRVASARGEASESLVKLYKALGGGWDPSKVEPSERKSTEPKRALEDSPEGKP